MDSKNKKLKKIFEDHGKKEVERNPDCVKDRTKNKK